MTGHAAFGRPQPVEGVLRGAAHRNRTDDLLITSSSLAGFRDELTLRTSALWRWLAWLLRAAGGTAGARQWQNWAPRACASIVTPWSAISGDNPR